MTDFPVFFDLSHLSESKSFPDFLTGLTGLVVKTYAARTPAAMCCSGELLTVAHRFCLSDLLSCEQFKEGGGT